MKSIVVLLLLFSLTAHVWAAQVSPTEAKRVAESCYQFAAARLGGANSGHSPLELKHTEWALLSAEETPLYYVFVPEGELGFVIVSAEDRILPVLGYSLHGLYTSTVTEQPEAFRKWMAFYQAQITAVITDDLPGDETIEAEWEAYRSGSITARSVSSVDPLVTTKWDQPFPYNALCPQHPSSGQRAVVGCVATAMAQIMRYHAHPQQGTGFHSYNHPDFGTISANFGATTYNWNNMPNTVSSFNEEVARLSFHCGVSIEMGYGVQVSGVSSLEGVAAALRSYFAYDGNTTRWVERQGYSEANWLQLMRSELDNGRPVEYAGIGQGGGHAWVMDGYDSNFFHMNWGWGGYQDGYFTLNNLNPSTGGTGAGNSGFNSFQQAVIGIQPAGGGGGGGGTPPTPAYANLAVYSNITMSPLPVQFASPFEVSVDIANLGNQPVSGDIGAAIFSSDGAAFIDFVDMVSGTLDNGFFYTLDFPNDGLPTSPGDYLLALFYRPTGGEWSLIPAGDFANPVSFEIVGPFNNIRLYAPMTTNPVPVVQGQPFEVRLDYGNFGNANYTGDFAVDLYTLEGDYIAELSTFSSELCGNCHFSSGITYQVEGLDVEPGSYLIATWNRPAGGNWTIVGNGDYQNPISIQVTAPAILPDSYEPNNSLAQARTVNLNFSGNTATWNTTGTNMHNAEDQDYFQVSLPQGYSYTVTARVHDSYNSGNGQAYTNDVMFGIHDGSGWTELYDDVMPQSLQVAGGTDLVFGVAPYFVGTLGTYQLDVNISRSPVSSADEAYWQEQLTVAPNPSTGTFQLALELPHSEEIQLRISDVNGRLVAEERLGHQQQLQHTFSLADEPAGLYFLSVNAGDRLLRQRLVLVK